MPVRRRLRSLLILVWILLSISPSTATDSVRLFDDTYLLVSGETCFGMERRQTELIDGDKLRIVTDLIQLTRLYGEVETTEVNAESLTTLDHRPLAYRETARSAQYAYELDCQLHDSRVRFQFFENSQLVKSRELSVGPGARMLLPESLPAFLVERLHQAGESTEIQLLLPAAMEVSTCAVALLGTDEAQLAGDILEVAQFRVACEAGDHWRLRVAGNGRLIARRDEESAILHTLETAGIDGRILPLGTEFESFIEGEGVRIENPRHVNYTLYRLIVPKELAQQFQDDSAGRRCLDRETVGNMEESLFQCRSGELPPGEEFRRGKEMQPWLAATTRIRPDSDAMIALATELTRSCQDGASRANALLAHLHRHWKNDTGKGLRTSLQILESGRANAQERILLFVALARAIGIPVRLAVGVRFDGLIFEKTWFCELGFLSGWYPVDPSRGSSRYAPLLFKYFHGGSFEELDELYQRLSPAFDLAILDWRPRPQFNPQQAWRGMKNQEFVDEEFALTIPVPADFEADWTRQPEPLQISFRSRRQPELRLSFSLQEGFEGSDRFTEYATRRESQLRTRHSSLQVDDHPLAGRTGYHFTWNEGEREHREILIQHQDLLLTIRLEAPRELLRQRWSEIEASFLSFRI